MYARIRMRRRQPRARPTHTTAANPAPGHSAHSARRCTVRIHSRAREHHTRSVHTRSVPTTCIRHVRVRVGSAGRVLSDYRRQRGALSTPEELLPYDKRTPDERGRMVRQLDTYGGERVLWTPYEGNRSRGGAWVLQCRWGVAGHTDGVLTYERAYEWDDDSNQMRSENFSSFPWEGVPLGRR